MRRCGQRRRAGGRDSPAAVRTHCFDDSHVTDCRVYLQAPRIEAGGARLIFLSPCSPDLNPIDRAFARLKSLLRKAAERSADDLWARIGDLLDSFSADECRNDV